MQHDPELLAKPASIAQLRNVALFAEAMTAAIMRPAHLPGLLAFHGPSGYGKTFAATYGANVHRAFYVEARSSWTKRALCMAILREIGVEPRQRVYEMQEQIAAALATSQRPLILDEADHVLAAGAIEIIRDIHESSGCVVALIGEERLPQKLAKWERVHGRMLDWVGAQPSDLREVGLLADIYCGGIELDPKLQAAVLQASNASVRRICVNLSLLAELAQTKGLTRMSTKDWSRDFFTGSAPSPRKFA